MTKIDVSWKMVYVCCRTGLVLIIVAPRSLSGVCAVSDIELAHGALHSPQPAVPIYLSEAVPGLRCTSTAAHQGHAVNYRVPLARMTSHNRSAEQTHISLSWEETGREMEATTLTIPSVPLSPSLPYSHTTPAGCQSRNAQTPSPLPSRQHHHRPSRRSFRQLGGQRPVPRPDVDVLTST